MLKAIKIVKYSTVDTFHIFFEYNKQLKLALFKWGFTLWFKRSTFEIRAFPKSMWWMGIFKIEVQDTIKHRTRFAFDVKDILPFFRRSKTLSNFFGV